jgi:hypothetical protein
LGNNFEFEKISFGGESAMAVTRSLEAFWFKGQGISLAMGLDSSLINAATILSELLQPKLFSTYGSLGLGLWIGVIACLFSLICGLGTFFIESKREKQDAQLLSVKLNYDFSRLMK